MIFFSSKLQKGTERRNAKGASSVDLAKAAGCTQQPHHLSKGKGEGLDKKGVTWRRAPSREEAPHFVALGVGQGGLAGLPHARKREREREGEAHLTCSKSQSRRGAKVSTQAKRERWLNVGHDVQFK